MPRFSPQSIGTFVGRIAVAILLMAFFGVQRDIAREQSAKEDEKAIPENVRKETFTRLKAIWEGQQSDILSARIKYRHLYLRSPNLRSKLSAGDFESILKNIDTVDPSKRDEKILDAFASAEYRSKSKSPWIEKEYFLEGSRRRENYNGRERVLDGASTVSTRQTSKRTQIELFATGQTIRLKRLDEFRFALDPQLADAVLSGEVKTVRLGPHEVQVTSTDDKGTSHVDADFDETTGACLRLMFRGADGQIRQVIAQDGFVTESSGMLFPKWRFNASFRAGFLASLEVIQVLETRFNESLPDQTFVVGARQGDTVVDYRHPDVDGKPRVDRVRRDTADAREAVFDDRESAVIANNAPRSRTKLFWIIAINLLLLVAVACAVLLRKTHLKSPGAK